jgi:hypothetical protein
MKRPGNTERTLNSAYRPNDDLFRTLKFQAPSIKFQTNDKYKTWENNKRGNSEERSARGKVKIKAF